MRSALVAKHLRTTDYEAAKLNVWLRPQPDQAQQGLDFWWWPKDGVIGRPSLWIAEDFGCCASG